MSKKIQFLKNHFQLIIELDFSFKKNLSSTINTYFKNNKSIGSKDRKVLTELVFTYFRYKFYLNTIDNLDESKTFDIIFTISEKVLSKSDTFSYILNEWSKIKHNNHEINVIVNDLENDLFNNSLLPKIYNNTILSKNNLTDLIFSKAPITIRPAYSNSELKSIYKVLQVNNFDITLNEELSSIEINTFSQFDTILKENNINYEIQDNASIIVSKYIAELNKDNILDACAGSGGKSLGIKYFNKNNKIDLFDINQNRLQEFYNRNHNFDNIKLISNKNEINLYDLVIIDAPCTGSGTIRRNPDKLYSIDESIIDDFNKLQKEIIDEYSKYLKNGGILIYITCSLFDKENIDVVDYFLNQNKDFSPLEIENNLIKDNSIKITNFAYQLIPKNYNGDMFFISQMTKT